MSPPPEARRGPVALTSTRAAASMSRSGAYTDPVPLFALPGRERRVPQWLLEGMGWRWMRPVVDLVLLYGAVLGTLSWGKGASLSGAQRLVLLALPLAAMAMFTVRGLYRPRLRTLLLDDLMPLAGAISVATMGLVVVEFYVVGGTVHPSVLAHAWILSVATVATGRASMTVAQRWARSHLLVGTPALIVGAGHIGAHVARRLESHPEYGLRPVGFLDDNPQPSGDIVAQRRAPLLGTPAELREIVVQTGARHVVLAFSATADSGFVPLIKTCEDLGLEVSVVPRLFETLNDRATYETLGGLPLIALRGTDPKGWQFAVKHTIDRVVAALALIVLAPALAVIALAVKLSSPGPVLFRQARVGRDGVVFDLLKFRSMRGQSDEDFVPAAGEAPGGVEGQDRRTAVGRLLRRTSLDELPQLLNVWRGEMSLVGPRPERPEFVELFAGDLPRYEERHRVKSGITGWAQVHGLRGSTSLADRVEWDNYYIAHWSVALDLRIIVLTFAALLRGAE